MLQYLNINPNWVKKTLYRITKIQKIHGAVYSVDDINDFMKGSAVYISAVDNGSCPDLTGNVIQIYSGESTIQTYTIAGTIQPDSKLDIRELGSITNTNYTDQEKIRVFMSEAGIKKLIEEPLAVYQSTLQLQAGHMFFQYWLFPASALNDNIYLLSGIGFPVPQLVKNLSHYYP